MFEQVFAGEKEFQRASVDPTDVFTVTFAADLQMCAETFRLGIGGVAMITGVGCGGVGRGGQIFHDVIGPCGEPSQRPTGHRRCQTHRSEIRSGLVTAKF